jgi:hypothetical protein
MEPSEQRTTGESLLLPHRSHPDLQAACARCPENLPLPGVLRALMDFLGEDYGASHLDAHGKTWRRDHAYTYFTGVSGEAFRFRWAPNTPPSEIDPADGPWNPIEPVDRALRASDYEHEIVLQAEFSNRIGNVLYASAGHERLRSRLVRSIAAGKPVIAAGITGPAHTCILTGFGDRGDIVLGWTMAPGGSPGILFEPDKRFRFDEWYPAALWMAFLGERRGRPPFRDVCLSTFAHAAAALTTSIEGSCLAGPVAFDAWAEAIEAAAGAPANAPDAEPCASHIDPWIWDLAERRWYGARFVESALPEFQSHASELGAAVRILDEVHDLMWRIDATLRGSERKPKRPVRLADAGVRREIARIVQTCKSKDAEAARILENVSAL